MSDLGRRTITLAVSEPERSRFFPADTWAELENLGELTVVDGITCSDVDRYARAVADARVVITAWNCPPLNAEVLAAAPYLELMAHAAGSVKRFVTPESWERGVRVTQSGQAMAPAVAETALTLTLVLLRRLHRLDHALRTGQPWPTDLPFGQELRGCRVGVIGASRVGRAYIALVRALGAHVQVYDPYLRDADSLGVTQVGLEDLLRTSVAVAVHAPATPETQHLLGRRELEVLPDGAVLVNTARPHIIDMDALYEHVAAGRIDVGLDVHEQEPLPESNRWRALPNALLTPHIGGKTVQSRRRGGEIVVSEVRRLLAGEPLQHEVTRDMLATIG